MASLTEKDRALADAEHAAITTSDSNPMALSPSEVAQKRATKRMEQTTALETQIDQALSVALDTNQCLIDVGVHVLQSVFDEVLARYRTAGWSVEVRTDFHGNRQMVFELT